MPVSKSALKELMARAAERECDHLLLIGMSEEEGALSVWATEEMETATAVMLCFMAMRVMTDGEGEMVPVH